MSRLILASTSPYRRALLERLRVPFEAIDPQLDETPWQEQGLAPREMVSVLSEAKARALSERFADHLIVGSDQCAELDGDVLLKPGTVERNVEQLSKLSGRTHRLWTGVCVLDTRSGDVRVEVDEHRLTMRELDGEALRRYAELDAATGCAGGYRIESLGAALFERVEGSDATAIVGLPLMRLVRMLSDLGFEVLDHAR